IVINNIRNERTGAERKINEKQKLLAWYENTKLDMANEEHFSHGKEEKIHQDTLKKLVDHCGYLNYHQCVDLMIESVRLAVSRYEHEKAKADLEENTQNFNKIQLEGVTKQNEMKISEIETRIWARIITELFEIPLPGNLSLFMNQILGQIKLVFHMYPEDKILSKLPIISLTNTDQGRIATNKTSAQLQIITFDDGLTLSEVLHEYQIQQTMLVELQSHYREIELHMHQYQIAAENAKQKWLNQVRILLLAINESAVKFFNAMGLNVDICLYIPENDLFFIQKGKILISFDKVNKREMEDKFQKA
ncbi:unnamed protein product, partial [Didymodactylos carnosus]